MAASLAHEEAMGSPADGLPVSQHWSSGSNAVAVATVKVGTSAQITATAIPGPPAGFYYKPVSYRSLDRRGDTSPPSSRIPKRSPLTRRAHRPSAVLATKASFDLADRCTFAGFSDGNQVVRGSTDLALENESFRAASAPAGIDLDQASSARCW
jgi:hypothetical protein